MLRWLHELCLPHIAYEKGYIILLDGNSSHISFRLVMGCIKYDIRLFILPAHQPIDAGIRSKYIGYTD